MTEHEKEALLKFIGVTHAAAKQTDSMIIGSPKDIQRVSDKLSRQFEVTLNTPTQQQATNNPYADNQYTPIQEPAIFSEPKEYLPVNIAPQQDSVYTNDTLNIVDQLKRINLNLEKVVSILTKDNVKAKPKNTIKS